MARLLLVALVAALGASGVGCQAHAQQGGPERVRGVIVAVEARLVAQAESVTVRTDDGRELVFRVDPAVDVSPGHLREHMTLAEPVLVTYRVEGDGLLALRIDDG